jgi:multisubunit Na+/H+ antiporter MnhG subunit
MIRKIEITALLLIAALILFRLFAGMQLHVILRILLVLISIFYMWFGFFLFTRMTVKDLSCPNKRKKLSPLKITGSIVAGFIYSLSSIAIIHSLDFYRAMHFLTGLAFFLNLAVLGVVFFFIYMKKEKDIFFYQFLKRSSAMVVLFLVILLTPVEKRLGLLYKDHPRFIEAYTAYMEDPDDPERLNHLREERSAFR